MATRGLLSLRSYDEALFGKLCGERVEVTWKGERLQFYAARVPGVKGPELFKGLVPIVFDSPEDPVADYLLPCFAIVPSGIDVDESRMRGDMGIVDRIPADGATTRSIVRRDGLVVTGYSAYTEIPPPWPFSLNYDVKCRSRKRGDTRNMLMCLLFTFPKNRSFLNVKDSLGDEKCYTVFLEGISDSTEIADVTERMSEGVVAVRIEGEIDIMEVSTSVSLYSGIEWNFEKLV